MIRKILIVLSVCMLIPSAQAGSIHWDLIEEITGSGDTLTSGNPFGAATVTKNFDDDWTIDMAGLGFTAQSRTISWMDLSGLFNRVTSAAGSNFIHVQSDLNSCAGNGCPTGFNLGVSFFVGTINSGSDSIFVSYHENVVPEPSTIALFALGIFGLGLGRRKQV